jgi:hypothetical protein
MGLRNLNLPTSVVKVADGVEFTVRGFSPNDALGLYYRHSGQLAALFDQFAAKAKASNGEVDRADVAAIGTTLVSSAPVIMAEVIAIAEGSNPAADDFGEDVAAAMRLTAGVQLDALQKIGELTFSSDMPPGKFAAVVLGLAQSATASLSSPKA